MKGRPRSVERKIALNLTGFFESIGCSPVERIPVLGRTGPDISINEFGLVVDAKSRLQVPIGYIEIGTIEQFTGHGLDLIGVRMKDIPLLMTDEPISHKSIFVSKTVSAWFNHMDEWTQQKYKTGITALVLHKPGLSISHAVLIISLEDRRRFQTWTLPHQK